MTTNPIKYLKKMSAIASAQVAAAAPAPAPASVFSDGFESDEAATTEVVARKYVTQASRTIINEYFMTTKELTAEGKTDNNICVQYKILPEEILNLEITQSLSYLDYRWTVELHTEQNMRCLIGKIPSMGDVNDWVALLIMKLDKGECDGGASDVKVILKGAFFNKHTQRVAFQSSFSPGIMCDERCYPIKCHEEGWTSQTRRMCAPITFWKELQTQVRNRTIPLF